MNYSLADLCLLTQLQYWRSDASKCVKMRRNVIQRRAESVTYWLMCVAESKHGFFFKKLANIFNANNFKCVCCGGHWFDSHWFDKKAFSASLYAAFSHPKELFELSFRLFCTTCMVNKYLCFLLLSSLSRSLSLSLSVLSLSVGAKHQYKSAFPVDNKQKNQCHSFDS